MAWLSQWRYSHIWCMHVACILSFRNSTLFLTRTEPQISPDTFCKAFPFHLLFDRELVIRQAGTAISRVIPETLQNCLLTDIVEMVSHNHYSKIRSTIYNKRNQRLPVSHYQIGKYEPRTERAQRMTLHIINSLSLLKFLIIFLPLCIILHYTNFQRYEKLLCKRI